MKNVYIIILTVLVSATLSWSRSFRVSEIPNGSQNRCANCHINPAGGGPRNDFAIQLFKNGFIVPPNASGHVQWGPVPASMDADGDGVSNGDEMQDPFGFWKVGDPAPGNATFVTLPADSQSAPFAKLKVDFNSMNPHVGQSFSVRVIDKATGMEVGRKMLAAIPGSNFDVEFEDVLLLGHSYWVDFFADFNGNGLYDAPPADHAWRMEANNLSGDTMLEFSHNTNFVDIDWKNVATLSFAGMNPHVGQLLQVRVFDETDKKEVGRKRVESIPAPDFSVSLPVLTNGHDYRIDFYADLNGNGLYDAPPADHAWQETITSSSGDVTINFSHNTNFTDIGWDYLLRLQFGHMNPHLGEMLEVRIVEDGSGAEVNRIRVPVIPLPDFAIEIPGLSLGQSYHADFYADHNGNGSYDAPPADHAWRLPLGQVNADLIQNFIHNTNFTDIEFPTGVERVADSPSALPADYRLSQNYPNPFNPETTIGFEIKKSSRIKLHVYNTLGQVVRSLVDASLQPGAYQAVWDGRDDFGSTLNSGLYFYTLEAQGFSQTRRMLMLK